MSSFRISEIPGGHPQASGWTLTVGEKEIPPTKVVIKSKYGILTFGLRPEGYLGWAFEETGGGGAVTLLWARACNGEILVGLLPETRPNLGGGQHLCVVGGFVDPGETHQNAAIREGDEEAGLGRFSVIPLQGLPIVPNRLFNVANIAAGEGTQAFALEVPFEWLSLKDDRRSYQLRHILGDGPQFKKAENVVFMPWREAICRTPDALALSAIARLIATVL